MEEIPQREGDDKRQKNQLFLVMKQRLLRVMKGRVSVAVRVDGQRVKGERVCVKFEREIGSIGDAD